MLGLKLYLYNSTIEVVSAVNSVVSKYELCIIFYLFNLYLKLTKTSRIHITGHLHKNIATQNKINEC